MDVPSRREIPILWNKPTPKWTDGMALIWQLPILQKMKPSMFSQEVQKKVACAQKPLTGWKNWLVQYYKTERDHLNIERLQL